MTIPVHLIHAPSTALGYGAGLCGTLCSRWAVLEYTTAESEKVTCPECQDWLANAVENRLAGWPYQWR